MVVVGSNKSDGNHISGLVMHIQTYIHFYIYIDKQFFLFHFVFSPLKDDME